MSAVTASCSTFVAGAAELLGEPVVGVARTLGTSLVATAPMARMSATCPLDRIKPRPAIDHSASAAPRPCTLKREGARCPAQCPSNSPASREGLAERDLVGILEVRAHRQATGQARDRDTWRAR